MKNPNKWSNMRPGTYGANLGTSGNAFNNRLRLHVFSNAFQIAPKSPLFSNRELGHCLGKRDEDLAMLTLLKGILGDAEEREREEESLAMLVEVEESLEMLKDIGRELGDTHRARGELGNAWGRERRLG
ncbi:hypothetical protein F2Q69_00012156 [Brassica cretica]|uniref:Uncharacterized protein n=1 Tax=Brassica cretica TaxID=69181 RepID=A0A8S9R806_BRACR|nr:hypothetical protein F2Q69_00012156 [Brassica cretica]